VWPAQRPFGLREVDADMVHDDDRDEDEDNACPSTMWKALTNETGLLNFSMWSLWWDFSEKRANWNGGSAMTHINQKARGERHKTRIVKGIAKANPTSPERQVGDTALIKAAREGRTDVIKALLSAGSAVSVRHVTDDYCVTCQKSQCEHSTIARSARHLREEPEDTIVRSGHREYEPEIGFKEYEYDVDRQRYELRVDHSDTSVAGLTDYSASTSAVSPTKDGKTYEHHAARQAYLYAKNREGATAFDCAASGGHTEALHALVAASAELEERRWKKVALSNDRGYHHSSRTNQAYNDHRLHGNGTNVHQNHGDALHHYGNEWRHKYY